MTTDDFSELERRADPLAPGAPRRNKRGLATQQKLLEAAEECSLLLWASDGSSDTTTPRS